VLDAVEDPYLQKSKRNSVLLLAAFCSEFQVLTLFLFVQANKQLRVTFVLEAIFPAYVEIKDCFC
jgi:hypothetical protein